MMIFILSVTFLFSLYGCNGKSDTVQDTEEIEQEESDDAEEMEEEDDEVVSGSYKPESNKFEIQLPDGNWKVSMEEEGMVSLQSEDEQTNFDIVYLSEQDAQGAMGETPSSKEELEKQLSYAEVVPTVESFDAKTEDGVEKTIYTLKYKDGDYPYMIQGNFVKDGEYFTVIAITKQEDASVLKTLQQAVEQFKIN